MTTCFAWVISLFYLITVRAVVPEVHPWCPFSGVIVGVHTENDVTSDIGIELPSSPEQLCQSTSISKVRLTDGNHSHCDQTVLCNPYVLLCLLGKAIILYFYLTFCSFSIMQVLKTYLLLMGFLPNFMLFRCNFLILLFFKARC